MYTIEFQVPKPVYAFFIFNIWTKIANSTICFYSNIRMKKYSNFRSMRILIVLIIEAVLVI